MRSTDRRVAAAATAAVMLATTALATLGPATPAQADGPRTFSNIALLTVADPEAVGEVGLGAPYPSPVDVSGLTGQVQDVSVTLDGLSHQFVSDLDFLLVAPSGESLVMMSDVGDSTFSLSATDATITLADGGQEFPTQGSLPDGTYAVTDVMTGADTFPAPAPSPGSGATFAQAFSGADPNGTWNLFVVDDSTSDTGAIADGWSLTITTTDRPATSITASITPNPALSTQEVTLNAYITSDGAPVTEGSVEFDSDGGLYTVGNIDADGWIHHTLSNAAFVEGTYQVTARYLGTDTYLPSSTTFTYVVDSPTQVSGHQYCNLGRTPVPAIGIPQAYPLRVFVDDRPGATVTDAQVMLGGLEHSSSSDLDVMLVSPDGDSLVLLSDVPGAPPGTDVVINDEGVAATSLPTSSGSIAPTNLDDLGSDSFPAPAPTPSAATTFADSVVGGSANGTWSLYVVDDASGNFGALGNGWCLALTTEVATEISVQAPASSTAGDDVEVTATVTSGEDPVDAGTVTYSLDGGAPVEVGTPNATGQITFTLTGLDRGVHSLTVSYAGADGYGDTAADPVQVTVVSPTTTEITTDPTDPVAHRPIDITVAVTADDTVVTEGSVDVTIDGETTTIDATDLATTPLTYTPTSTAPIDVHAVYSGAETFAGSEGSLTLSPAPTPTTLSLTAPTTAVDGDEVTLVATVTPVESAAVPTGSITFSDGTDVLGTVPLSAGSAQLRTTPTAGVHTVTAVFASEGGFATNSAEADISVTPLATAEGPYTVAEGGSLTLSADGSSTGTDIGWDLDGDGDFTDATGAEVTLAWDELASFGIDDGPADHVIAVQAAVDGLHAEDTAELQVTNTGPEVIIDGPDTAVVGEELTLKLSADDPSSADMAEDFTYVVDWGDGSALERVVGPADPPVSHTYTEAGDVRATFSVVDRDGDGGGEVNLTITVSAADEGQVADGLPGTGFSGLSGWAAALFLLAGGLVLLLRRRTTH